MNKLSAEEQAIFQRTTLYKHHFSTGKMVRKTGISELVLVKQSLSTTLNYNVLDWNNNITLESEEGETITDLIREYINGAIEYEVDWDNEYEFSLDARYFEGLPELFITLNNNTIFCYGDYTHWLMQGNKPRYMEIITDGYGTINIPNHVIYLCNTCEYCEYDGYHPIFIVPEQILFYETDCKVEIDAERFIASRIITDEYPMQEFTNYAKRQPTKSSRN